MSSSLDAIRLFYADLERSGSIRNYKLKVVLVGLTEAGKTSIVEGLKHNVPRPTGSTTRLVWFVLV